MRSGVHNFFGNIAEIDSFINYTLQGSLGRMVRSVGRFVINSTIGIGGLFESRDELRLPKAPTGFGTTLAKWGMHPGPTGHSVLRSFHAARGHRSRRRLRDAYMIEPGRTYRGEQVRGACGSQRGGSAGQYRFPLLSDRLAIRV